MATEPPSVHECVCGWVNWTVTVKRSIEKGLCAGKYAPSTVLPLPALLGEI